MKTSIIITLILIVFNCCHSQSFEWLDSTKADKFGMGIVHYNPDIAQVLNDTQKYTGIGFVNRVLRTKLNIDSSDYFVIEFWAGPSDDLVFNIYKEMNKDSLISMGRIGCNHIYLPGNGNIYTIRINNDMFPRRQKFIIYNDRLNEIRQSYYYVGIKTINMEDINLFADQNLTIPLAYLPKNTPLEIILNNNNKYLVKTPFGLLGWIEVKATYKTPFKDLTFHGD